MTEIEHRVEALKGSPPYSERTFSANEIKRGVHRSFIGGHWDTHGQHQVDFLVANGLRPEHTLLDIGCGCFRAGRPLVDYLEPKHYYGIDANLGLLQAGYDHELSDAQRERLPAGNLRANDRFDCDFGVKFDMAIAQSVFSHVSLNHIRLCLFRLARQMDVGGKFYATFYEQPPSTVLDKSRPRGRHQWTERNPYWYYRKDMKWAAKSFGQWNFRYIGDWQHPNGQMMVEFTRRSDDPTNPALAAQSAAVQRTTKPGVRTDLKAFTNRARRWAARHIAP
jgi:hypothetical protein